MSENVEPKLKKKKINSKKKGSGGELEVANLLKKQGFTKAQRTEQYNGNLGGADVIGMDGIHIEVKRVEKLNIDNALSQAERDCKNSDLPIVVHRKNGKKWKVTLTLELFLKLLIKGYTLPTTFNENTYDEFNKKEE